MVAGSAVDKPPVLWQIRFSHYNEKARWALDYKGVPHVRRSLPPGPHTLHSRRLGGTGTTPILKVDGQTFADSTDIIAELERRHPEPPLYPAGENDRARALELEDWFDRELGPGVRAALFHALLPHREITVPVTTQGVPTRHRIISNAAYPLVRFAVTRGLGADDEGAMEGRRKTVAALDRLETELDGGQYLVGGDFSAADLTAAALFSPLVGPPEFPYEKPDPWPQEWEAFRAELRERPGYRWVEETYRKHRGTSREVPAS